MISLRDVTYRYPDAPAPVLSHLTLEIPAGQFLLVIGDSGSGKSTFLRCLNGLVPHFHGGEFWGHVTAFGMDTMDVPPRQMGRTVGFVFQDPDAQFVAREVEEELAFGMENLNVPQLTMRKRIEEVLDQLKIAHLRHRSVDTLSGGEKQRVAIADALVAQPRALVLDEPTSQLDPQAAEEVLQALRGLNDDLGITIVLAEHRLERVVQFADRVMCLTSPSGEPIIGPAREVMAKAPLTPPLISLGKRLGWSPLPLTIKEGMALANSISKPHGLEMICPSPAPVPRGPVAVEVRGLRFAYDGQEVLRGVDLSVRAGELVALMGRNGSGKTTLLKHMVGLLRPKSGQVRMRGEDIAGKAVDEICRAVGLVPQNPNALLFADTLDEELAFTLRNRPGRAQTGELLRGLDMEDKAQAYPRDLSEGERQRAAIAAMLVSDPAVILLDEPTRGLDYRNKRLLARFLRRKRAEGKAVSMATHDVELVATCAGRVVLMGEGEVVIDGPTREVLSESATFSTQVNKLFRGTSWLTVEDAIGGLGVVAGGEEGIS